MTKTLTFLLLLICGCCFAQNSIVGKKYRTETTASCSETTTGGFMTYSYSEYEFEKDSVKVYIHSKRSDMPEDEVEKRKYCYYIKDNYVRIDTEFFNSKMKISANGLVDETSSGPGNIVRLVE